MTGSRTVAVQEAAHEIDGLPLTICSDIFSVASINKAQELVKDDTVKRKDMISLYRNRTTHHDLSLHRWFYDVYCKNQYMTTQGERGRILVGKGLNCKPRYPVDYNYARGMILMHKPWNKKKTHYDLLRDKRRTKRMFHTMVEEHEFPSAVIAQYICAVKYTQQRRIEIIARGGITQDIINVDNLDDDERDLFEEWQHHNNRTDHQRKQDLLDVLNVSVGHDKDWSISDVQPVKQLCPGQDWISYAQDTLDNITKSDTTKAEDLNIPLQRNGKPYTIESLSTEQKEITLSAVDTIMKFLNNDKDYKPYRATVMGGGGTGKSFIINTIISIVRNLTGCNDTVQVAAPSGAAAYNVQGCTLHRLLKIKPKQAEKPLGVNERSKLLSQLKRLLVLIIDERSQINSMDLAAAEIHTRECIYRGTNNKEYWGGLPVVLLFGDDYQLPPVASEGAIAGYEKDQKNVGNYTQDKLKKADKTAAKQLCMHHGHQLFVHHMTENVYELSHNYRVKSETFKELLKRLRNGTPTLQDANDIFKLHKRKQKMQHMADIEKHPKTMFLFATNNEKEQKNVQMLAMTSKETGNPVARLKAHWGTNKHQGGHRTTANKQHFHDKKITHATDICVRARVAIDGYNFLPQIGLYNGAFGEVIDIVYKNRPKGPNDKDNNALPDYVVVDFPHLILPNAIKPWDQDNPTVCSIERVRIIM